MKKSLYWLLVVVLMMIFGFSAWQIASYYFAAHKTQARYDALSDMVQAVQTQPSATAPADRTDETEAPSEAPQPQPAMLPEYVPIYEMNPDLVGWISIADTYVDYPVLQTPEDPEFYLTHDFYGDPNERGCIFAEETCNVSTSDNVVLYGHNMKDGSMFAGLYNYRNKAYWEAHPLIRFDTLTERRTYQVFAVFRTTATVGEGFPYHTFHDAVSQAEFDSYVAECKGLALYGTGVTPTYGEKLLCLSTCEYTQKDGRFVVVAVQVE